MVSRCTPLDEHAVNSMRGNRSRDTKPELVVRRALRDAGYPGYRLQWNVPGKPDICYPGRHVAIFVNGCFWHRCPYCKPSIPKHNEDFWRDKFEKNVERDSRNQRLLNEMGWKVIVIWECQIHDDLDGVVQNVIDTICN